MAFVSSRSAGSVREGRLERPLELLVDRMCLSATLVKPVGIVSWAQHEVSQLDRAEILDLASAAVAALIESAAQYEVSLQRFQAFLEVLVREIERVVLDAPSAAEASSFSNEGATALLAMLDERDNGTCSHSKATAEWSRRLATAMSCTDELVDSIALCALLHDIGKVATPETILLKPGALDEQEWEIMREHAAIGARILNEIPSLRRCAMVVRAHHERFDGRGYPDRLAGLGIPFESRVVAVADAFHAMISERPYRRPIAPRDALKVLEKGSGSQWDPDAVDAMLSMFARRTNVESHGSHQLSSA
jgi:putative nucleotidyltransferase with HDIG domain